MASAIIVSVMSKDKKSVYKPKAISGYPEWLPEIRYVEQQWFDHIRRVFESYGFCNIETPSVEELDVISAKGEVDKEIYVLERLHKDDDDGKESRLALHFDQTVPLARYVAQHFGDLTFPFKRYQMQRVWRGERPQKGRFREFYQCDIDVIGIDQLGLHFDAEMPAIIYEVLSGLPGMENEKFQLRISNRKIVMGCVENLGIFNPEEQVNVIRIIDKRDKISEDEFYKLIKEAIDNSSATAKQAAFDVFKKFFTMADAIKTENIKAQRKALRYDLRTVIDNETYQKGLEELSFVMDQLSHLPEGAVVADLSIVRGLDYYTGTVYETTFVGNEGYGSICSGGRYDDLASSYINKNLPGVGISIGFSRLFAYMLEQGKLPAGRKSPANILMVLPSEERRAAASEAAQTLRARGYKVELFHSGTKIGKQFAYAEKKGIPYVWIPPFEDGGAHEIKDMHAQTQTEADPANWTPKGQKNDEAA